MRYKSKELYRNTQQGKIAGVCSGLADYFGWEAWLIRILVVSGVLFGLPFLVFIYLAAWFILDKTPKSQLSHTHHHKSGKASDIDDEVVNESIKVKARIWQSGEPPKQAFHDIRRKYSILELKLQKIEHYVTSPEFMVSREINNL